MNNLRNKVQLIGRLGKDVELKTLESGKTLAKASMATTDIYKNADGEKVENTQWHSLTFWGKNAETADKYLKKGSEIIVDGRLSYSNYEDKDGNMKYYTEIIVNEFVMTGSKK